MIWIAKPYVWQGIPPAETVYEFLFTWDIGAEILAEAIENWLEGLDAGT